MNGMRTEKQGLQGFTLLELLLAVLVFGIVLAAMHVVFMSALKLRATTTAALERSLPLQQTFAVIKRDLANLVPPGGVMSGALQSTPTISTANTGMGQPGGPYFYTAVGIVDDNSPWAETERVAYRLASPTNSEPGMELYRSVTRNLLPMFQDEAQDQFLMGGVESISFQYYNGTAWQDTWDSTQEDSVTGLTNNLPRAIRLELVLASQDPARGVNPPLEMVVPIMVMARTNLLTEIAEGSL